MRKGNIAEILKDYLDDVKGFPFVWGEHDCCLFAANFVLRVTGTDYAKPFRGKYSTPRGAKLVLTRYGEGSVIDTINKCLGPIAPSFAQRGDIVCHDLEDIGPTVGICTGATSVFVTKLGITYYPTLDAIAAWRTN